MGSKFIEQLLKAFHVLSEMSCTWIFLCAIPVILLYYVIWRCWWSYGYCVRLFCLGWSINFFASKAVVSFEIYFWCCGRTVIFKYALLHGLFKIYGVPVSMQDLYLSPCELWQKYAYYVLLYPYLTDINCSFFSMSSQNRLRYHLSCLLSQKHLTMTSMWWPAGWKEGKQIPMPHLDYLVRRRTVQGKTMWLR